MVTRRQHSRTIARGGAADDVNSLFDQLNQFGFLERMDNQHSNCKEKFENNSHPIRFDQVTTITVITNMAVI
jgi:hypothetical protein